MSFDDIPEDLKHCEPCPVTGCEGSVSENKDHVWECDTCGWKSPVTVQVFEELVQILKDGQHNGK